MQTTGCWYQNFSIRDVNLADVFISYSSADRARALDLEAKITATGRSVWIDQRGLNGGEPYYAEIGDAIAAAKAVVVLWSQASVQSEWVYAEAQRGKRQRKLVAARIEPDGEGLEMPLPFDALHSVRLERIDDLLRSIENRINGAPMEVMPGRSLDEIGIDVIDAKFEELPIGTFNTRPTSLLHARHAIVPFDDSLEHLADTLSWAREEPDWADGRPALARLVHGAGGLGKTRLMIEACRALFQEGWITGFVPRDTFDPPERRDMLARLMRSQGHSKGMLLVIDYAESVGDTWLRWLAERAVQAGRTASTPLRIVFLARGAGEWWQRLYKADDNIKELTARAGGPDTIALAEFDDPGARTVLFDEAERVFRARVNAFRRSRGEPDLWPEAALLTPIENALENASETGFDRPLAIQMAALLFVIGELKTRAHTTIADLLDSILELERQAWSKYLTLEPETNPYVTLARALASITAFNGVEAARPLQDLIEADPIYRKNLADADPVATQRNLRKLQPPRQGGVEGVEPDLIGEHHVLSQLDEDLLDACLSWADADPQRQIDLLTVLDRATRKEHGETMTGRARSMLRRAIDQRLTPWVSQIVDVSVSGRGDLPDVLLSACPALDTETLATLETALDQPTVRLALVKLALGEHRVAEARAAVATSNHIDALDDERVSHKSELAAALNNCGLQLSAVGRREDALAAAQEAVDLYRALAQTRPDAFRPDLAGSLTNLVKMLSDLGRREDALAAAQEAVDLYRALAQTRPDAFRPDLAMSLNNLGAMLSDLGRREDALAAAQEAVDLYRALAQARPDAFRPNLAMSLNNLGAMLSDLGRREDALAAAQEAVDLYRALAQVRPDAFRPDLAMSLNNLGAMLSNLGRREDALTAAQEAVAVYRALAQVRPDAFRPDLAMSLTNLGNRLSNLGRREDALAAAQEAVDLYRALAQVRPDAFRPDLAMSLTNLGNRLSVLGRREDALAAAQEAVDLYRALAQARPDAFRPNLAASLTNLGNRLSDLGRREDALAAAQEAVDLYRALAQARPGAFRPDLAMSLTNLGNRLSNLGRREHALAAAQEAVDLYRALAQVRPDAFQTDLARSLGAISQTLLSDQRPSDAAAAAHEGLEIMAPFVEANPQAFGGLTSALISVYIKATAAANDTPDQALLDRIQRALG